LGVACLAGSPFALHTVFGKYTAWHEEQQLIKQARENIFEFEKTTGYFPDDSGVQGVAINQAIVGYEVRKIAPGTILLAISDQKWFHTVDDVIWTKEEFRDDKYWISYFAYLDQKGRGREGFFEHPEHKLYGHYHTLFPELLTRNKEKEEE